MLSMHLYLYLDELLFIHLLTCLPPHYPLDLVCDIQNTRPSQRSELLISYKEVWGYQHSAVLNTTQGSE